jgi:hypothetical protein
MTLIELLVTLTILATIVGSIAGAFAIGFQVLNPGSAPARLIGNNDLIAFEQQIGADVNRAVCLSAPGQQAIPFTPPSTLGCRASTFALCTSGYLLCLAWYVAGSTTCHTVTYSQTPSSGVLLRTDRTDSTASSSRVGTGGLLLTATWTAAVTTASPPGKTYQWTNQVIVTVTQQGARVVTPQTTRFYLAPLVADPLSAAVPAASTPC